MVDLRGEMILPKEWALRGLELDLAYNLTPFRDCPNGGNTLQSQRLGQFKHVPDKPGHYAFDFGEVLEGTHFLTLRPSGGGQYLEARMPFLLSPDAKDDLKFEIPEPALLTVHLVDSKTRKTIEGAYVMWQQVSGVCLQNIFPASGVESGVKIYRDLVPLGDITYCVTAEGYEYLEVAIKVVDGANEHTLELTPK